MPDDCASSTNELNQMPYSGAKWRAVMQTKIGQELKTRCEVPQELPQEMLSLLMRLNERSEHE
jgi:hypothetical protein